MSLAPGARLGGYEILGSLGAGGMGEVYRARDMKLDRQVALKLVLDGFVGDPDRAARFEREAKALAALHHPRVATLFGLERADGRHFLVMELVEGETLAERITRTPGGLPADVALPLAGQIAEALEVAHEKGIVHRDLKPANVKVTPDGDVKVLDFGLAKMSSDPALSGVSSGVSMNSPTFTSPAVTQMGVLLGTAAYMSPEQARGYVADHRSDIFSFGIVLYRMLTGRDPFPGDTISDVLAAVLARDPDLASLPATVPPRVVDLLRRCLEKNPKKRWQAIGDVRYELESILASPRNVPPAAMAAPARALWRRALPFAVTALLSAAIVGTVLWKVKPAPRASVVRFALTLPEGQAYGTASRRALAVSPDGTRIAYASNRQVYVRSLSSFESTRIFANESRPAISYIEFSPDGEQLAFDLGSGIVRMPASGGLPSPVYGGSINGLSWSGDAIVFATVDRDSSKILRVPGAGAQAETLLQLGSEEFAYAPQLLPDGRTLLFTLSTGMTLDRWDSAAVVAQRIGESSRVTVVARGSEARFLPSGHLVYADGGILVAALFDPATLQLKSTSVPVIEGVARAPGMFVGGNVHYAVSDSGSLVYLPGPKEASSRARLDFVLADAGGNFERLKLPGGSYFEPRQSPDGRYIAFTMDDWAEPSIWVYDTKLGGAARRLTFGKGDRHPVWSHDSTRIAFQSEREGDPAIYWQRADGSDVAKRLTKPEKGSAHVPHAWSKDGSVLLFDDRRGDTVTLMMLKPADNSIATFGGVVSKTITSPTFSPDGRWLSYSVRQETNGLNTIFVQPFPATGALYQVSKTTEDGHHSIWARDGRQLFYTPGPGTVIVAVPVTATATTFEMGEARLLNRPFSNLPPQMTRPFDLAADGRFLGLGFQLAAASGNGTVVHMVLNWAEELRARVPSR